MSGVVVLVLAVLGMTMMTIVTTAMERGVGVPDALPWRCRQMGGGWG